MSLHPLLAVIHADPELIALLDWHLDFDVAADLNPTWFRLAPFTPHVVVARDGTDGAFVLCGSCDPVDRPLLYISSEAQAGVVGANLHEFVAILLSAPYWFDLLKFSGGGSLNEMRASEPHLQRELVEDQAETIPACHVLRRRLGITPPSDPVAALHRSVVELSGSYSVESPYGDTFESLFNRFTVADNPSWFGR